MTVAAEAKNSKIKLSVITPVFNGAATIEETVLSVLEAGTNIKLEYIIVDDGSTDATSSIIKKIGNPMLRYYFQENSGEASAVNYGLKLAKGDYCIIVSADDPVFTPELFEESISLLDLDDNLMASYPDWRVIDEVGNSLEVRETIQYSLDEMLGYSNCIPGPGACFRRVQALEIGGRNTGLKYLTDFDFWLRLSTKGNFVRIPRVLAQWRRHPLSTSVTKQGAAMARERIWIIEDYLSKNQVSERLARCAVAHAYYFAARLSVTSTGVPGKKYLIKSFKYSRGLPERASFLVVAFIVAQPLSNYVFSRIRKFLPTNLIPL
jgi:glycosyltransferase involved in cell wall biosynthesis